MAKKKTATTKKLTTTKKKPTTAKKKPTSSARKTSQPSRKPATAKKKATAAPQHTRTSIDFSSAPAEIKALTGTHEPHINLLPPQTMENIMSEVNTLIREFQSVSENNLTLVQRRRKIGAGIRNYGFIEKVADLAAANPQYAQFFNVADLENAIKNIDVCRDLALALQSFVRMVSNTMLVYSDDAFTMALIFYNMVRSMSRRGDPIAMELFRTLSTFFRRTRRAAEEPTTKELERDIHALLHGKKDGKIVVENVSPVATKGVRKVVDDVHSGRALIKESAEAEIKE